MVSQSHPNNPRPAQFTPQGYAVTPQPARRANWPMIWGLVTVFLVGGLTLVILFIPAPFVIQSPGPTVNVLGSQSDTPVLEIDGVSPEEKPGQLRMVTVSERGGPGSQVTMAQVIKAWLSADETVYNYSDLYPDGVTAENLQELADAQMTSSHSTASVAALEYLGYEVPAILTIAGAVPNADAEGKLLEGDKLISITTADGIVHVVDSAAVPFALMKTVPQNSELQVKVLRDGKPVTVAVKSMPSTDSSGQVLPTGSKLGLYLQAETELPIDITLHLEKIGGPSAGTVFALGIIDALSEEGIVDDQVIAGTGALGYDGEVQAIGGIKQKMFGAKRDGAEYFLAPVSNCDEVVGNIPNGLEVFSISTLSEAVDAVKAINSGDTSTLLTCE